MKNIIAFNCTQIGASHITKDKPCQDYSLSWSSEDKSSFVAIVCDGHGGDTYVRSDVGARIAADVSLKAIKDILQTASPSLFLDKAGAVTARPTMDNLSPLYKEKTETEEQAEQNKNFYEQVKSIKEQDAFFTHLFGCIYTEWKSLIEEDSQSTPFNEQELELLGKENITKAYGCTLMAFVRTPLYWFAFHIGDGKMLCVDYNHKWFEPVPWDCNCFLNVTTSLCANNPIPSFRYAFNGKGDFPIAVILGSDGLDDSWQTMPKLQSFYTHTLSVFGKLGADQAVKELNDYLPKLSEKGSRDDMSVAGIIDMDAITNATDIFAKKENLRIKSIELEKLVENIADAENDSLYLKICQEIKDLEQKCKIRSYFEVLSDALKEYRRQETEAKAAKIRIEELLKEKKEFEVKVNQLEINRKKSLEASVQLEKELEDLVKENQISQQEDLKIWSMRRNETIEVIVSENLQKQMSDKEEILQMKPAE